VWVSMRSVCVLPFYGHQAHVHARPFAAVSRLCARGNYFFERPCALAVLNSAAFVVPHVACPLTPARRPCLCADHTAATLPAALLHSASNGLPLSPPPPTYLATFPLYPFQIRGQLLDVVRALPLCVVQTRGNV